MTHMTEHNTSHVITIRYFAHLMGQEPLDRETGYEVTASEDGVLDGDLITSSLIADAEQLNDAITILFGVDFRVGPDHDYALSMARCSEGTPLCRVMGMNAEYTVVDEHGRPLAADALAQYVSSEYRPYISDVFDLGNALVGDVYPKNWIRKL